MLEAWSAFFAAEAGVAVTVFSILFVTLQLRSERWVGSRLKTWAAVSAMTEIFLPLVVSLITLMPAHPWRTGALIAGGLGLLVIVSHVVTYRRYRKQADKFDRLQAVSGGFISGAVYTSMIISAFLPSTVGLYLLAGLLVWLLFSGASEAWLLLDPRIFTDDSTN